MSRLFAIAAFALLGAGATAEPVAGPAAEPAAVATDAGRVAESDTRGSKDSPVAVEVIALPDASESEKREQAEERRARADSDRMLVWLTAALVLATIGLWIATLLLWRATRRLVMDARENAERQMRAYVGVESSSIALSQGSPAVASVVFKNYGKTPAYEFTIQSGIEMAPSFEELPPPAPEPPGGPRGVLSPGATVVLSRSGTTLIGAEHVAALQTEKRAIFVYGEVSYVDAFKKRRFLAYRLMTGGSVGLHGKNLASCEQGNNAD